MEKLLKQSTYYIPDSRVVNLGITDYDASKRVFVRIIDPKNFENDKLTAIPKNTGIVVRIPKRINNKMIRQLEIVLSSYQIVDKIEVKQEPKPVVKEEPQVNPNPIQDPPEEKRTFLKTILSGKIRPDDFISRAIEETQKRKDLLKKVTKEVNKASALEPIGLDGKTILTGDNCDYSRGMSLIENLKTLESIFNEKSGAIMSQRKPLCEYIDIVSFSGVSMIAGLYVALGLKSKGAGDLNFLSEWYKNELSSIYSPTSLGELGDKGKKVLNKLKFSYFQKSPNPGRSIRYASKVIGSLFSDKHTGRPFQVKDLLCEIYQPLFLVDEQTRVFSMGATPEAKLVDIILDTGLDPLYFQSRKIELGAARGQSVGISNGPVRRSFDLPIAQHNHMTKMISVGSAPWYQEAEEKMEGMTQADAAFIKQKMSYRLQYVDTRKYMQDHPGKVNYTRIEAGNMHSVMANSILISDLEACKKSAERSTCWSNSSKPAIEWR